MVIVDDYSRFTWKIFLKSKADTPNVLIVFFKMIQTKLDHLIAGISSNHGIEFENTEIEEFFSENGISKNFTVPRPHQQNGVVERKNKTLVNIARTMLIESNLPHNF